MLLVIQLDRQKLAHERTHPKHGADDQGYTQLPPRRPQEDADDTEDKCCEVDTDIEPRKTCRIEAHRYIKSNERDLPIGFEVAGELTQEFFLGLAECTVAITTALTWHWVVLTRHWLPFPRFTQPG